MLDQAHVMSEGRDTWREYNPHMETVEDPRSTIDKEVEAFDTEPETAFAESTIRELISTYPTNEDDRHVLVKVIAINALYHARVLDIDLQHRGAVRLCQRGEVLQRAQLDPRRRGHRRFRRGLRARRGGRHR